MAQLKAHDSWLMAKGGRPSTGAWRPSGPGPGPGSAPLGSGAAPAPLAMSHGRCVLTQNHGYHNGFPPPAHKQLGITFGHVLKYVLTCSWIIVGSIDEHVCTCFGTFLNNVWTFIVHVVNVVGYLQICDNVYHCWTILGQRVGMHNCYTFYSLLNNFCII